MTQLYLSRVRLRPDASIAALAPQLLPDDDGERAYAAHRLIWSLFAGDRQATRDFLFRETIAPGRLGERATFMALSPGAPREDHPLLAVETKEFAPALSPGDRLGFSLRANATVTRRDPSGRPKRHDVVMDALARAGVKPGERAPARPAAIDEAGHAWLRRQGEKAGFRLVEDGEQGPVVDGYDRWRFRKLGRDGAISVLDFEGALEVVDPPAFLARLTAGFGRAKAFGCGLMLIRRI